MRQDLIARRALDESSLLKRSKRAIAESDLPRDADPVALTRYIGTINFGLAVQAATGATRAELQRVVEAILRARPPATRP